MKNTMKKTLLLVAVLVTAMMSIAFSAGATPQPPDFRALAEEGQCGENVYWNYNETTGVLVISGTGCMYERGFLSSPFYDTEIKSVVIEYGVTGIADYAFLDCGLLETVSISASVMKVGFGAFRFCTGINSITVDPENLMYSSDSTGVLFNKDKTELIKYPEGNRNESYTVPDSVKIIKTSAFEYAQFVETMTLPAGIKSIESNALPGLDDLYFNGSERQWQNVTIDPEGNYLSDTNIHFLDADGYIPEDPETELESTTGFCGENVTYKLYDDEKLVISGSGAMANYYPYKKSPFCNSKITSVVIEEGVTTIGSYAFDGCSELETVTIADTVTSVNEKAFEGCYNISEVYAADAESWLKIFFDYGYDADEECVYTSNPLNFGADLYFGGNYVTQVDIPETITEIKASAFYNYQGLKVVSIPATVTSIGDGAFWNCRNLEGVVMSGGVTAIGEAAFYSCDSIEGISIPGSVASIGYEAFADCDGLESVALDNGVKTIGRLAFRGCDNLKEVIIPKSVTSIAAEAFAGCMNIKKVYAADFNSWNAISFAPYSVGDLYNFSSNPLFYGADLYFNGVLVTDLEIPSGVTEIKPGVFCNCASIKRIAIPASVNVIGDGAFGDGNGITEVYYVGSNAQWAKVKIGSNNEALANATIRFASTVLGKTSSLTATQSTSAIKLVWAEVPGANVYRVYQRNGNSWAKIGDVAKLNGLIGKLKAGTKYTFAVKAGRTENGKTEWATTFATISTATKNKAPSKVTSAQNTGAIKLSWTATAGADGYRVYYKSGSTWKALKTTTATSHTISNLKAGAKYTFAIQPYIKTESGVVWGEFAEYLAATTPATVTAKATSTAKGKVALSWNAVNGADGYQVYYKTGNGSYKLYKVYSKAGTLNFSNLKSGTTYSFVVRAGIKTSGGNIYGAYKAAAVTVK